MSKEPPFLAITVGNTRTSTAILLDSSVNNLKTFNSAETNNIVEHALAEWKSLESESPQVVIASTNDIVAEALIATLTDQTSKQIWRIGDDVPVAIGQHLDPETMTGVDRLLNAAAAWEYTKQACVVVDAGTCVTVDFVDGEGTFHGGAIAPGARMQLESKHTGTGSLPEVEFEPPLKEAFGKNTAQAMLQGVFHGIQGMVRQLSEQYASRYGAYPRILATGGDALTLFEEDDLIEQIIPDLQFQGIAASVSHAISVEDDG